MKFATDNTHGMSLTGGSTTVLTIGSAAAADTAIVFDGNAADYHIGLEDDTDLLVIGKDGTLGDDTAIAIDGSTLQTRIGSTLRHTRFVNAENNAVADDSAETLLTFTVPNITSSTSSYSSASMKLHFVFHTRTDASNIMTSSVMLGVTLLRIAGENTTRTVEFIGSVITDETGSTATHTGLAIEQFTFSVSGSSSADQTVLLQFTNDYDSGAGTSKAAVAGSLDVAASAAAEAITVV